MSNLPYMLADKRVWVPGHRGMVGSAIVRRLDQENCEVMLAGREIVDLEDQKAVNDWMHDNRPDVIMLAAAKVGGIHANNTFPVDFLYSNLMIEANVIHAAHQFDVERLLFLGSSCIYPKFAPQPIREDYLLSGPLEPTNEWYAIAKIVGIKLVQAYRKQYGRSWISAMPTNLYGPGDTYDLENGHVLPALLRKFHEAKERGDKEVVVWGSGSAFREFMHCEDLADALVFLIQKYDDYDHVNIGSGSEVTIRDLAGIVAEVVGYEGKITWDTTKPDGTPRKALDTSLINNMGWKRSRELKDGISSTYQDWRSSL